MTIQDKVYQSIAKFPYCTFKPSTGVHIKEKTEAVKYPYIQFNGKHIKAVIVDLDYDADPMVWRDKGLQPPTWITVTKETGTMHLVWMLQTSINNTAIRSKKAIKYYRDIQYTYTKMLDGDIAYSGPVTKNPFHSDWTTYWISDKFYNLKTLTEGIDLIPKPKQIKPDNPGRNFSVFEETRFWSYQAVRQYWDKDYKSWLTAVRQQASSLNIFEEKLNDYEIRSIARSVAKWTWRNITKKGFSDIQRERQKRSVPSRRKHNEERWEKIYPRFIAYYQIQKPKDVEKISRFYHISPKIGYQFVRRFKEELKQNHSL